MNWKRFTLIVAALMALCLVGGTAMAQTTHSRFVTGAPVHEPKDNSVFVIANTLDFGDLRATAPSGTAALAGVSKTDTVRLIYIPAGTIVKSVGVEIYSAWGTAGITAYGVTIGDGDDADGWLTSVDFGPSATGASISTLAEVSGFTVGTNTTGGTHTMAYVVAPGAYALKGGKSYTSADTIDAVMPTWTNTAYARCTNFVLRIWAECVKPSTKKAYVKPSPAI